MELDLMEAALGDRAKPGDDFHRRHIGDEQGFAVRAVAVGERQRTREARRRAMDDAARMGVVEVEAMHQDAVHQHGVAQGELAADTDNRRSAAPELLHRRKRNRGERIFRRGERDAHGIEHEMFRPFAHRHRDLFVAQGEGEGGKLLRQRPGGLG